MSNKDVIFSSSISLQNELLKLISNEDAPVNSKHTEEDPSDIFSEILEAQPAENADDHHVDMDELKSERKSDDKRVLTAQEIIYRALLNDDETIYEDYQDQHNLAGGNSASEMINNILTGGNKGVVLNTSPETKNDVFDEILEGTPQESAFAGGNKPTTFAERKHVTFAEKLNQYKSIHDMVDAVSSSSSSEYSDNEDGPISFDNHENTDAIKSLNQNVPSGFVPIDKNNASLMSRISKDDNDDEEDSNSYDDEEEDLDSSSSEDEFIFPNDAHPVETKVDKRHNAKYIHIINQFKNPVSKNDYHIIGGSTTRPKTVTVINAFPYIIKATPDNA